MTTTPDETDAHGLMNLDSRAVKALTERMTVLGDTPPVRGDDARFQVVSEKTYLVDLRAESCTCPDAIHRGVLCKHGRRVLYAIGREVIPEWADLSQVDPKLGEHAPGSVRVQTPQGAREWSEVRD